MNKPCRPNTAACTASQPQSSPSICINQQKKVAYNRQTHANLLTALEENKISAPYQCREGFCGACRATLVSGSVDYPQEPLAFIREGEVLLCCSVPLTDLKITLD